ncbi:hypothetical protein HU230_0010050 [Bradyrhizobium quebecense]|uniref:Uncharacterized protein n=1 Tax=Bradyrhizobium quebecense TaxID=2748629 RepID=A0A973WNX6_9BRAD|nr:hypothetical protein [Bradyrhizobium quebecense]UGA46349.1 hypothetical protein HU230_0010050 [Bradyrhizobium quebecense]
MKDAELRGLVLKALYDVRHTHTYANFDTTPGLPAVDRDTLRNIIIQLTEKGLAKYTSVYAGTISSARISAEGIDVVEGNTVPPISITFDNSISVRASQNVQIGQGNTQTVTMEISKLINAIDGGVGSLQEKEEAKSLLKKVVDNPLVKATIEWWAKSHAGA